MSEARLTRRQLLLATGAAALCPVTARSDQPPLRPRARDLGIPFDGASGPHNAITDVSGVTVGHTTLIDGEAVRTGVTVVVPPDEPLFAGAHRLNGNGELTGLE